MQALLFLGMGHRNRRRHYYQAWVSGSSITIEKAQFGRALDWRSKGPWFNPGFRQFFYLLSPIIGSTYTMNLRRQCMCVWAEIAQFGRALDWRSKGPWFNPGFRQFFIVAYDVLKYFCIHPQRRDIYCSLGSTEGENTGAYSLHLCALIMLTTKVKLILAFLL